MCARPGDAEVGKTAVVQMFQTNGKTFPKNYLSTSGVDLAVKVVNVPDTDTAVELYIHDCAGSELHRHMMPSVVRAALQCLHVCVALHSNHAYLFCTLVFLQWVGCAAIILAYDMTNADSFKSCAKWMEMATEAFGGRKIKGMSFFSDECHRKSCVLVTVLPCFYCTTDLLQACCSDARATCRTPSP